MPNIFIGITLIAISVSIIVETLKEVGKRNNDAETAIENFASKQIVAN